MFNRTWNLNQFIDNFVVGYSIFYFVDCNTKRTFCSGISNDASTQLKHRGKSTSDALSNIAETASIIASRTIFIIAFVLQLLPNCKGRSPFYKKARCFSVTSSDVESSRARLIEALISSNISLTLDIFNSFIFKSESISHANI